jgi:hypothetical protein
MCMLCYFDLLLQTQMWAQEYPRSGLTSLLNLLHMQMVPHLPPLTGSKILKSLQLVRANSQEILHQFIIVWIPLTTCLTPQVDGR